MWRMGAVLQVRRVRPVILMLESDLAKQALMGKQTGNLSPLDIILAYCKIDSTVRKL